MNLMQRVGLLMSANLHDLMDQVERPEAMVRQAVRDMETGLDAGLRAAATALANERLCERRLLHQQRQANRWQKRAEQFVQRKDDAVARQALRRARQARQVAERIHDELSMLREQSGAMRERIHTMQIQLEEARATRDALAARSRLVHAHRRITAFAAADREPWIRYQRLVQRVEQAEAEVEAWSELVEAELPELTVEDELDAELAALKRSFDAD